MNNSNGLAATSAILILLCTCTLFSCKKEESGNVDATDTISSFILVLNGVPQTTTNNYALTYFEESNHVGRRFTVDSQTGSTQISTYVICWDFQNPPYGGIKAKKYYANPQFCQKITASNDSILSEHGGITCQHNSKTYNENLSAPNTDFVYISKCDNIDKRASGNFNFVLTNNSDPSDLLYITGSFSNQKYIVSN